jgi:hypothetical protein
MEGWEIIDPAAVFADTTDWLARWPSLHRDLSVVIVFGDEAGYVGAGCLREVSDAIVAGIPVLGLDLTIGLSESVSFDLLLPWNRTPARTARLVLGGCTDAGRSVLDEGAA